MDYCYIKLVPLHPDSFGCLLVWLVCINLNTKWCCQSLSVEESQVSTYFEESEMPGLLASEQLIVTLCLWFL